MAGRKGRRTNKQTWEKEEGGREKRRKEADQNGSPVATAETKQHHCHLHRLFPSPGSSSLSVKKANTPLIRAKKEGSFPIGKDIIYPNDPRFSPSDHVRYTSRAQTEGFAFCCEKPSFASTPPLNFFYFFFFKNSDLYAGIWSQRQTQTHRVVVVDTLFSTKPFLKLLVTDLNN